MISSIVDSWLLMSSAASTYTVARMAEKDTSLGEFLRSIYKVLSFVMGAAACYCIQRLDGVIKPLHCAFFGWSPASDFPPGTGAISCDSCVGVTSWSTTLRGLPFGFGVGATTAGASASPTGITVSTGAA